MSSDERVIVALDYSNEQTALETVHELGDSAIYYKVGMELYYTAGNEIIKALKKLNKKVFLDLKLHDIPNTVAKSLGVLTALGVDMLNVHAGGGLVMMSRAAEEVRAAAQRLNLTPPKVIAVTVLTSIDEKEWDNLHYQHDIKKQVVELALLAKRAGLDGVVASPQEASAIRQACGNDFLIVTPGVRPEGAAANDQSRIATPLGAILSGATHLVVGRPITQAKDKEAAARSVVAEIRGI
ncbi:MAG TPA: orotidine-5'-phosphate decarboxylase [Candidatus Avacidaminococcus intestinavium]|uniref:Orotidine 5'-phosphate decarboxylase n=1 Tax=Candidatus Avacidaminococcus intestinavium TaxID=2840684 RepID=A0A9D1MPC1_9FIRM|nr:orotidine-5'-phosphate decarboxylase [Candidatus Avacidaminococcus intestinavium]